MKEAGQRLAAQVGATAATGSWRRALLWLSLAAAVLLVYGYLVGRFAYFANAGGQDADNYRAIANGHIAQVVQPFSSRAAFAIAAGALARSLHVDVRYGFMLLAWASLLVFVAGLSRVLKQHGVREWYWIPLGLATPFAFRTFGNVEMPDAAAAAAAMAVFIAAASGRWTLAAALCGAGIAVRETGVILAAFVLVQAWRERRWRAVQLGTLAVIAGWACSNHFRHAGLSNVHQMPELLYMAFKIPVNLLVEVFGLDYWTDSWTYVCHPTAFIVDIPVWLPLGKLHRVGVCVRGLAAPLTNVFILATTFGALPAILLAAKAKSRRLALPPVARLALYYGLLMFALGVCSGRGVQRLVDYGWPAFLIATALAARELDRLACWPVILLHLAMGVANLVMLDFFDGLAPPALLALGGLAAQASLYALLRTRDLKAAVRQNIPPATQ